VTANSPGRHQIFKTPVVEVLSWTKPDVCQVDGRRPAIRSPEANGGGVSASRFAGTGLLSRARESERLVPEMCYRPAH